MNYRPMLSVIAMLSNLGVAISTQAEPVDRTYEGDWYVSDDTDNNTGERKVDAFQMYLKRGDPNYVTLRMRCSHGKPTFFVEWEGVVFPEQAVLTIGSVATPDSEPTSVRYLFEKSDDVVERGLRASPDTSAKIVSSIGEAKYATVPAHLSYGSRTVGMDVAGTQRAWSRVTRHCPVRKWPQPPL